MKAKLITFCLALMVASSSVYAFNGPRGWGCDSKGPMPFQQQMAFSGNGMQEVMMTLSTMDLSKTQWSEIRNIMFEMRDQHFEGVDTKATVVILSKDGTFDKEGFIKNRASLSKEMIEAHAQSIDKVLQVLTDDQRKTLASKLAI
ncbi:MAG: hypothetical protein PHR87_05850 [Sulfurospirillaceae bacterium]|nr:hypothetical protein [Sulfurospirillaceae bacterium]